MNLKQLFYCILFIIFPCEIFSQEPQTSMQVADSLNVLQGNSVRKITWNTDPLSPAKAAFYSAIFPGLGQIYNKSYWKVPIVWGAVGFPLYMYIQNEKQYQRYRSAYKRRLDGFTDDEFYSNPRVSDEGLRRAQQLYQRNKEISLLVTIGLYALNIIEANVDAHLKQYNVDENLSIQPYMQLNEINNLPQYGLNLSFKF